MRFLPFVLEHFDFPSIVAGHGYDVGTDPRGESSGDLDEGGIPMLWVLAGVLLTVVAVGTLVSVNPSGARRRLKSLGPKAFLAVVIAAPLIAWTASSGGASEKSLIVERWINDAGKPELIVSLGDDDLNSLETTAGKKSVRVECVGREGQIVLDTRQKWPLPFVEERGYEYPHAHQVATLEQIQQADRCTVRGTSVRLEADVEGVLTP